MVIDTARLRLRPWREGDRAAFAALLADPEVMADLGGPVDPTAADAKLDRYAGTFAQTGLCRWAVENRSGGFLGYAGIMPSAAGHPLGPHFDIGWRLARAGWGRGYATEAAAAALRDGFERCGLERVLAYTAPDNIRSRAVMARLRLRRDPARDFVLPRSGLPGRGLPDWHGLVWVADRGRDDAGR